MTTLGPPGQSPYCKVSRSAALVPPATLSALCYITYIVTSSRIKHGHPWGAVTLGTTLLLRDAGIKRRKKAIPAGRDGHNGLAKCSQDTPSKTKTLSDQVSLGKVR